MRNGRRAGHLPTNRAALRGVWRGTDLLDATTNHQHYPVGDFTRLLPVKRAFEEFEYGFI